VTTVRRRLDVELVRRGLVESRARAVEAIEHGRVEVGGARVDRPARQVSPGESVALRDARPAFVSRGGQKLDAALRAFELTVAGRRAVDVGASTGGFTDCLLQRGAAHVYAVDVGRGQLAWALRTDDRVTVLERVNARALEAAAIDGAVPLAVVDVSFISLLLLATALTRVTTDDADLVLLLKPQFEAGRDRVPRGGVVRDAAVQADVLRSVSAGLGDAGLPVVDAVESPIRGADGNREFLLHVRRGGTARGPDDLSTLAEPS
jgi:23S rRNA (cytidine1920-2'-O)/16S rRNA (cytidine1409-2'-O)-methyltransferase